MQTSLNAFTVMISSQHQICLQQYPSRIDNPRNKKDELHNAVLMSVKQEKMCWTTSEVSHGVAANAVRTLTDVLWFLGGHQTTLCERSCEIPVVFDQFANFNRPELSKHRKRTASSLSSKCTHVYMNMFGNLSKYCIPSMYILYTYPNKY